VAIGGIDESTAHEIAAAGAGVAVISAVAGAEDPEAATRQLVRRLAPEAAP
jgi:thiamine-phosphate pyrophosphorylase